MRTQGRETASLSLTITANGFILKMASLELRWTINDRIVLVKHGSHAAAEYAINGQHPSTTYR
jgi:hypothetical protein